MQSVTRCVDVGRGWSSEAGERIPEGYLMQAASAESVVAVGAPICPRLGAPAHKCFSVTMIIDAHHGVELRRQERCWPRPPVVGGQRGHDVALGAAPGGAARSKTRGWLRGAGSSTFAWRNLQSK